MSESEMDGKDEIVNGETEAERVRFENERMTRRRALRKFGFMAGMTVFATLSVDDLARIASKKLQDTEATKGIGDMLAKEFRSAGVAMANPYGGDPPPNPYNPYEPRPPRDCGNSDCDCWCICDEEKTACDQWCYDNYGGWGCFGGSPAPWCASLNSCLANSCLSERTECYSDCNEDCV